jgi:uncharacterized protein (TIGR03435 family)
MEIPVRLILLGLASLLAQAGRAQSFEVASIKSVEGGPCTPSGMRASPASVSYTHVSLRAIIRVAYDVQDEEIRSPAWLDDTCYDIFAKIPAEAGSERVAAMLQQLVADRFGLRTHWDNATVKGYKLVVARGGPKLTPAKKTGPDAPPRRAMFRGPDVEMQLYGMTMEQFARELGRYTGRPTVNVTDLAGAYDITIECSTESVAILSGMTGSDDAMPGPSLYTAVRSLGLNLVSGDVIQRRLVVDAVSRVPTPN